jgi:hypothetical protein
MKLGRIVAAVAATAALVGGSTTVAAAHQGPDGVVDRAAHAGHASKPRQLAALRHATAAYHSIAAAEQHGPPRGARRHGTSATGMLETAVS